MSSIPAGQFAAPFAEASHGDGGAGRAASERVLVAQTSDSYHVQVADIQRSRVLAAAVSVIDSVGYSGATVSQITGCARVSRRTFYELFSDRDECLIAVFDENASRAEAELVAATRDARSWCERVRVGLWTILSFLERESITARACVVEMSRGGPELLGRRERLLVRLAAAVDAGSQESRSAADGGSLNAEGVVGAAFMIIQTRLARRDPAPLTGLLGELCALIVLPYLGPAAARREQSRVAALTPPLATRAATGIERGPRDPLAGVSMRMTYRTARVLQGVAAHPGASNREIAMRSGIHDAGQISKLLARLEGLGLLANRGGGHARGEPNAWALTAKGAQLAQSLQLDRTQRGEAA